MKDLVEHKELVVSWVPTGDNLADFFTKKLPRERFCQLRDRLMGPESDQNHAFPTIVVRSARVENWGWDLPVAPVCSVFSTMSNTYMEGIGEWDGWGDEESDPLQKPENEWDAMEGERTILDEFDPSMAILSLGDSIPPSGVALNFVQEILMGGELSPTPLDTSLIRINFL
jgi:hypothetical protein